MDSHLLAGKPTQATIYFRPHLFFEECAARSQGIRRFPLRGVRTRGQRVWGHITESLIYYSEQLLKLAKGSSCISAMPQGTDGWCYFLRHGVSVMVFSKNPQSTDGSSHTRDFSLLPILEGLHGILSFVSLRKDNRFIPQFDSILPCLLLAILKC